MDQAPDSILSRGQEIRPQSNPGPRPSGSRGFGRGRRPMQTNRRSISHQLTPDQAASTDHPQNLTDQTNTYPLGYQHEASPHQESGSFDTQPGQISRGSLRYSRGRDNFTHHTYNNESRENQTNEYPGDRPKRAHRFDRRNRPPRGRQSNDPSHSTSNSFAPPDQTEEQKYKIHESATNSSDQSRPSQTRKFIRDRNKTSRSDAILPQDSTTIIQSEISENQLKSNTFECMICCDNVHRASPIWYCSNCFNIFHLKCAIEWCNKSIKSRDEAIANAQYPSLGGLGSDPSSSNGQFFDQTNNSSRAGYSHYQQERANSIEWPCPTCREVLHSKPSKYICFCGKVTRPEVNRHRTPHSCGQLCGRKRPNADCPHACNSICHPGRCNACPLTSKKSCYCGKLTQEVKCSVSIGSCDQVCGKPLSCGQHMCTRTCHAGSCGPCDKVLALVCHCGNQTIHENCDELSKQSSENKRRGFSCDKICGKMLNCQKHSCTDKCHPGPDCPSCKLLSENLKTCPCGSTSIKKSVLADRKSCTDSVPTCENKCNRLLICGPEKNHHKCQKKCHVGPCPPCKLKTSARCKCGLSTKSIDCSLMFEKRTENGDERVYFVQTGYSFECETRCNVPKNCGRHRCQSKCCQARNEVNSLIHRCDQVCNRKLPCGLHNCGETCHPGQCGDCTNIGWEELTCHCGASVMYPPIPCAAKQPACPRPCRRSHACGHPVKHECHDDTEKCAPCIVFVKRQCFCGSESKDSVYCYLSGYSCGKRCRRQLACRQHTCERVCHDNECEIPTDRGVIICTQPCPNPRYTCKHPCGLPCHGRTNCPQSYCKKIIEVSCECGNRTERIECHKLMKDADNRNKVAMLSMNRTNQDSIIVDLSKKPKAEACRQDNGLQKKLDCDDTCSVYQRNKALAEALDIAQPDLKPSNLFGEDPLRLLKEATAQDYKFVAATYSSLVKFVKSAKESDRRFIFMQFPPADRLRREVVHELAHHFNCSSESREEEPFKQVVVRAYKSKSCVPDFTIEQLLPVTD